MSEYNPEEEEVDITPYEGAPDNQSSQMVDGKQDSDDEEDTDA
jgi:hypothetical protein